MATLNLYLSDALKADMESVEGVNWSQVAQQAFRTTIEIERMRKVEMNQAGLIRLRNGRGAKAQRAEAEAEAAGKHWAIDEAAFDELERVAEIDTEETDWSGEPNAFGWGSVLMDAIRGEGNWERRTCEDFCEEQFGIDYPAALQVRAFIDGAKQIFAQV